MVNDKNHLYTSDDLAKDRKHIEKTRTQQQFSQFSVAATSGLTSTAETSTTPATNIITKPQIGNPIDDTYGLIGLITQIINLDVFGSTYNTLIINNDVAFAFDKIPQGRHVAFTIDFVIDTITPPTVTLDPRVINPPVMPLLTNGLRVVLKFEGVRDDFNTRFTYLGGTLTPDATPSGSAFLRLTADQDLVGIAEVVLFNNNIFLGSGISSTATTGVFRLSGSRFILNTHLQVRFPSGAALAAFQWESADDEAFTVNDALVGTEADIFPMSSTDNDSSIATATAEIDATSQDKYVRLSYVTTLASTFLRFQFSSAFITNTLGGSGGSGGGGGDVTFPIDFPEEVRVNVSGVQTIDFTTPTRHAVILTINGSTSISLTNTVATKLQIASIKIKQDGTGGRAFTGFVQTVANEQAIIDAVAAANGPNDFVVFIVRKIDGLFTAFLEDSNVGGSGTTLPVDDTTAIVKNVADNTKQAKFDAGLITTATTRTYNLPNADTALAGLAVAAQTWTGENIFNGNTKKEI